MSEDKNGPESSRLLDTVPTSNLNHKDLLHRNFGVEKKKNGDVCHHHHHHHHEEEEGGEGRGAGGGGGEPVSVCLEMATTISHVPTKTPPPPSSSSPPPPTTATAGTADTAAVIHDPSCMQDLPLREVTDGPPVDEDDLTGLEDLVFEQNCCTRAVERLHAGARTHWRNRFRRRMLTVLKILGLLGYVVYFAFAMKHQFGDEGSVTLLVLTLLGVAVWVGRQAKRRRTQSHLCLLLGDWVGRWQESAKGRRLVVVLKWLARVGAVIFMAVFLMVSVWTQNPENLRSLVGIHGFIALLFCFSHNPSKINWHTVFWAVIQQMVLGVIILRTQWGLTLFEWVGRSVKSFLDFGLAGAKFLFGQEAYKAHKVAIITVSIMVYFNAFIASLFHLGVVQAVINSFGRFLGQCLGTGPIESFAASANIFISMTETPLVLRPYLSKMTKAELHAVMTCGFASISGAVLGAYAQYGVPANHLLAASVMSAPAALAASRLLYPETKHSKFRHMDYTEIGDMKRGNLWEAASRGAGHAGGLALAALTSQLAFVSLLALTNGVLQWFGDRVGVEDVTFKWVCSYLFYPLVWAMGTGAGDCRTVAALLGIKLFGTPIMAYTELADLRHNRLQLEEYVASAATGAGVVGAVTGAGGYSGGGGNGNGSAPWSWQGNDVVLWATNVTLVGGVIDERSEVIALYMLCGFSTITSIGVCLGVLLNLVEERKDDITSMIINTLVAGNFASFLTAAVAGLMINGKPLPT